MPMMCKICGEIVYKYDSYREHLMQHNPNAITIPLNMLDNSFESVALDKCVWCDNCCAIYAKSYLKCTFPDIPDLIDRLNPGGMVPAGQCPACCAFVYPLQVDWLRDRLAEARAKTVNRCIRVVEDESSGCDWPEVCMFKNAVIKQLEALNGDQENSEESYDQEDHKACNQKAAWKEEIGKENLCGEEKTRRTRSCSAEKDCC